MIYNKEASFSYPVFAENINAYANPIFNFDVTNLTATDDELECQHFFKQIL